MKYPIILFGSPTFGVLTLAKLCTAGFTVQAVVTTSYETPVGRKARVANIPLFTSIAALASTLGPSNQTVGVIAAYGEIIPKDMIEQFSKGILNIHFSSLPKYRGAAPVPWAILNGDRKTAVTIFLVDEGLDTGPLLAQHEEIIQPLDTTESLGSRLAERGSELLIEILPGYFAGTMREKPQDEQGVSFAPAFTKEDGKIDLAHPPEDLGRRIRAFYPWPTVWTYVRLKGIRRRLLLLPGNRAQVEGKRPVSIKQLLEGYPELGEQLKPAGLLSLSF